MAVGLNIGSKTIKVVDLEKSSSSWRLRGAGVVGYSGNSPENLVDAKELAALADILRKLVAETKVSKRNVILSLPESQISTRLIKFPLLSDQEIASAIKWEAEQYIPFPVSEAVIQHKIIERNQSKSPPDVSVLLIAAPQSIVSVYMNIAQMAGLEVHAVETEMLALTRSLAPESGTFMILNLGAKSSDVGITRNGNLVFTRSIPTGGDAFTRSVAQSMNLQISQAEEYKRTYGLIAGQLEGKVRLALEPVVDMVVDEVKKAIHFYQTEERAESPKSVIITGGGSSMKDLTSVLSNKLGIEVVFGNPFTKVNMTQDLQNNISSYAPLYSIALGCAMRN